MPSYALTSLQNPPFLSLALAPYHDHPSLPFPAPIIDVKIDAAEQFRAASRSDLADKEDEEVKLLNSFLPPPLTNDEVERFMAEAVSSVLTSSPGAQVGSPGAKGSVNPNALVGKSLKAFWANVPSGNAGSIPNEEVTKRLKVLIEERLQ